jgi:hypothetical protein
MKGYVRPAVLDDAVRLAPLLREEDKKEIWAYTGKEPYEALLNGVLLSDVVHTVVASNHVPIAIFGVLTHQKWSEVGVVWLLGTPLLKEYRMQFLRNSRDWVQWMHQKWPILHNYVYAENRLHITWLKWLGFKLINLHQEFGINREPFYEFVRITDVYRCPGC